MPAIWLSGSNKGNIFHIIYIAYICILVVFFFIVYLVQKYNIIFQMEINLTFSTVVYHNSTQTLPWVKYGGDEVQWIGLDVTEALLDSFQ